MIHLESFNGSPIKSTFVNIPFTLDSLLINTYIFRYSFCYLE